jgi:hypothetical protein
MKNLKLFFKNIRSKIVNFIGFLLIAIMLVTFIVSEKTDMYSKFFSMLLLGVLIRSFYATFFQKTPNKILITKRNKIMKNSYFFSEENTTHYYQNGEAPNPEDHFSGVF